MSTVTVDHVRAAIVDVLEDELGLDVTVQGKRIVVELEPRVLILVTQAKVDKRRERGERS